MGAIWMISMVAALMAGGVAADERGEVLWRIGKVDHDYREFAVGSDFASYNTVFPGDVEFQVGKDAPSKAFASIHPGPYDDWGGKRERRVRIRFDLKAPTGSYELRIDLVDTCSDAQSKLLVAVNGTLAAERLLERGAGVLALVRPEKGKDRRLSFVLGEEQLREGRNEIELRVTDGSWVLYDAVSFIKLPDEAMPALEVKGESTLFYVQREGQMWQEVKYWVWDIVASDQAKLEVFADDQLVGSTALNPSSFGFASGTVDVWETHQPRKLRLCASAGEQHGEAFIMQVPERKWRIYVAPSTHTDIGYTDIQDKVISLHNRNTDRALELCAEFPSYHWNIESSWAAQMWLRDTPTRRHEELFQAARDRRIGIEASYVNALTGLCSGEALVRTLYYSARLHREHGIPFVSCTLTDVPSHVWTLPSILAGAGVRYLSCGMNGVRAPVLKQNIHRRSPFWWEGPDGARVLTWFTSGYSQAGRIGLRHGVESMPQAVEKELYRFKNREDYPYDAVLLHGAYSDNEAMGRHIAESLDAYNRRYAYPKVILCANDEFFRYIEKNFADKIPTVRGGGGSWWEDGAGSSARETGLARVVHEDIVAAETAWAVATGIRVVPNARLQQFHRVWDNVLLYDEHTWGAHTSITEPDSDFVRRQWAIKATYAIDATEQVQQLLEAGLQSLATQVDAPDGSVLVFNPAGRPRSGVVEVEIPRDMVIVDNGNVVPQQSVFTGSLDTIKAAFRAEDVPAVGYRIYQLATDHSDRHAPTSPRFNENTKILENDFYRVTFDADNAAIASIVDKNLGKELVDESSAYKLGQLIYAAGGGRDVIWGPKLDEVKFSSPTGCGIQAAAAGPIFSSVTLACKHDMFRTLELETILYEHEPRIDFVLRMDKKLTYDPEAVYLAFPFAGSQPQFRYEIGGGSVRPNEDHFPGACRDWFSVQRWVTVNTADAAAVAWSPIHTPLITLCEMTPGKWLDELKTTNGTIFAYVMNNYWFTNYRAGQEGWHTFRYSLTSATSISPEAASLFGEQVASPLRVIRSQATRSAGKKLPRVRGYCRVEPANAMLTTIKWAEDGKGLIIRIRETAGRETQARITTKFDGVQTALRCDLVERVSGSLPIEDGTIVVDLPANGMATIRLE